MGSYTKAAPMSSLALQCTATGLPGVFSVESTEALTF